MWLPSRIVTLRVCATETSSQRTCCSSEVWSASIGVPADGGAGDPGDGSTKKSSLKLVDFGLSADLNVRGDPAAGALCMTMGWQGGS